ncbi:SMI1/KNR4 family protein [Neisseria sp. Ec49-e6-T10]|uniref:SMI1/KNR4 family protein n=1 Tax=Neisseria sp. Ec49-e6-T10 TaxID=3140744 RepID=UPI003EBF62E8
MMIKIDSFGSTKIEYINQLAKKFSITLPNDYAKFLLEHNGGTMSGYIASYFETLQQNIFLEVLFGIGLNTDFNLEDWNNEYKDELLEQTLIIGSANSNGLIVLVNQTELQGIYYWDHCLSFSSSTESENTYKLSDSFQEFFMAINCSSSDLS